MRRAARAIVLKDDELLVMHRNKFGHQYFTLVGGEVEPGEEPQETVIRELVEETTLEVANPRLVYVEETGDMYGTQYVYLCDYVSGQPALAPDSIEAAIMKQHQNLYIPMWMPFTDFGKAPFLSKELKQHIVEAIKNGFPKQPETFQSHAEISYTE